jgi:predicted nucleic acid-binding protein
MSMALALGWLDTNIFMHAPITSHREHARSRALVDALTDGRAVLAEDKPTMLAAVGRWAASTGLSFVDAYLTELAARDSLPVCSANARDFPATPNSYTMVVL